MNIYIIFGYPYATIPFAAAFSGTFVIVKHPKSPFMFYTVATLS